MLPVRIPYGERVVAKDGIRRPVDCIRIGENFQRQEIYGLACIIFD